VTFEEALDWVITNGATVEEIDGPDGLVVRIVAAGRAIDEPVCDVDAGGKTFAFRIAVSRLASKISAG
jgi:hypothetical protein